MCFMVICINWILHTAATILATQTTNSKLILMLMGFALLWTQQSMTHAHGLDRSLIDWNNPVDWCILSAHSNV